MIEITQSRRTTLGLLFILAVVICFSGTGISAAEIMEPAASRFQQRHTAAIPDFQKHVVPLLGQLGCNSAKCHGSFQGQGDFRLSLFGFDFTADHTALTDQASSETGSRLKIDAPADSLILLKPTEQIDHDGGTRFAKNSWEHHLLLRWIETGAQNTTKPQTLVRLDVEPAEIVFAAAQETASLKVTAVWSDGQREDVTCLSRFRTNNDAVVQIRDDATVIAKERGDTHIVIFYDNGVAAVPVMRPYSDLRTTVDLQQYTNPIDQFVAEKLVNLGLVPSATCSDTEFLRRVSIDMTGTLPTPTEIQAFRADSGDDKRQRKINQLLKRPAYAGWWANKLCDFTGCSPMAFGEQTGLEVGHAYATQWYDWIYLRLKNNLPYDQLVEGIVLAKSRSADQTSSQYAAEMSSYVRRESPADFSQRKTMPHYWTRNTVNENTEKALSFAHSFLGIQLQCAECHKHPFDKWTQRDFNDFSQFFAGIQSRGRIGFPQFAAAQRGLVVGWPELLIGNEEEQTLGLLRSGDVTIAEGTDPRQPLMDWMREPNNPWFARAFVNRVWAGYFHVGIVDPPDEFTPANPPSNPRLLDWLAKGFIENGFDMHWLHRQITTSQTYQRSWRPNETNGNDQRNFSRAIPRRIPAEVLYDALKQVTAATSELEEVRTNLKRRAAGHLSMRMAGTHAMKIFGKPERALNCDCERVNEPTLLQSVFMQNDPLVRMRLADSNWIQEIQKQTDMERPFDQNSILREAWLRTVNRPPTANEMDRAIKHLTTVDSFSAGLNDLLWALLNTKEFLLNH